jgi:integrase
MPRSRPRIKIERGLYRAGDVYWACVTPRGERQARWERLGAIGIQEARRLRDEFAYKLRSGELRRPPRRVTVKQVADEWLRCLDDLVAIGELRPRTRDSYRDAVLHHVVPTYGSRQIATISPDDLVRWHAAQRRQRAAAWSIRARWIGFRGLLGYAARTGQIPANPADLLTRRERPKPGRPKERYLSRSEIAKLLKKSSDEGVLITALLVFSGMRASEVLGLVWEDVDFGERVIRVRYQMSRQGKRVLLKSEAARRDIVLMAELARLLRRRRLAAAFSKETDLIISNGVGKTLGYSRFRAAFADAVTAAGLASVTPHTCRHTFASILIDRGRDVEFVSRQLGHSSTKTTWDIYVHLFRAREHADAARRELDAAFGPMLRDSQRGRRGDTR